MAEALVGDIVGRLRIDTAEWQRGLQSAIQSLQQFAQAKDRVITNLSSLQQSLTQNAQTFQQFHTQINQTNQQFHQTNQTLNNIRNTFNQFNTQLNQTNQTFTTTNQTINNFNTQITTITTNVNNARQAAQGFGSAWSSVVQIAGGIGLATSIQGIVGAIRSLITESIQAAARMENLRAQFSALQGAAQGAITLQGLFQTAQRLGIEFGTLATSFRQFDAATQGTTLQGERARRVFEQITTGMRAMGASSDQVGRALVALQQMVSKGTVSQEELRQQLGDALPGAMGIAARAFGVTTAEMNKMIEKGMEATSFVQTFANQVQQEFGGKAAIATNTLTTAWQRFRNELEQFSGALAGSALTSTLRDLANSAATLLETLRKGREERERAAGGAAPALPPEAGLSPAIQARQSEIDRLAQRIEALQTGQLLPGVGQFFTPMIERVATERRRLIEEQTKAVERFQRGLQGEGGAYEGQTSPVEAATERMLKIVEDGQKRLREIDLQGAFLTPLEQADQKTKAWEETTKKLGEEWNRIGEGLRRTLIPTGRTTPFDPMIERLSGERGLDPNLMRALIEQESGFNPQAVSRAGARGLMQLMPGTAAQYGVAGREFEPEANLRAGMNYFADLLKQFNGNVERALTAYNAGPGRGGIPLPTGENATFARDVLRRIPQGPGDIMQQAQRQREALRLAEEAEKPDTENAARIRATGREQLRAIEEEERQADAAMLERRRQAVATGQEFLRGVDAEIAKHNQQMELLKRLAETYGAIKTVRDENTASELEAALANTVHAEEAAKLAQAIRDGVIAARDSAAAMRQMRGEEEALRRGRASVEQTREEILGTSRRSTRLRQEFARTPMTQEGRQEAESLLAQEQALRRVIEVGQIWRDVAFGIGSAWTQALRSIAEHTATVGEAFKAMGKSILQTFADIAAHQATEAFFKLGLGILTSALGGGISTGAAAEAAYGAAAGTTSFPAGAFAQGGAVINHPTMVMMGENPASNPEYILNRQQMQQVMSGSSGQGSNVTIMNYPSKEAAETNAARERAQGRTVIINEVLSDLRQGSGSQIGRMLRMSQT